jgi:hypothetical protein
MVHRIVVESKSARPDPVGRYGPAKASGSFKDVFQQGAAGGVGYSCDSLSGGVSFGSLKDCPVRKAANMPLQNPLVIADGVGIGRFACAFGQGRKAQRAQWLV